MIRRAALLLAMQLLAACISREQLVCTEATQCSLHDGGQCIDGGCAYPDDACPSGQRFSGLAGLQADECVPVTADDSGSGTTGPGEPAACSGVDCSGAGTCVLIDEEPTCACAPGYFMVGLECLLDPCDHVACHFVDDIAGDDANDGSRGAPWRSLARVSQAIAEAQPGDHFLLRRGGVWGDADGGYRLTIANATGTAEAPIVVGAFGPLADGAPRIAPGNAHITASSHVELRDLDIEDDPTLTELSDLFGHRPCVGVQQSDHVLVLDNRLTGCDSRGVWVYEGSSYTAIVGNEVIGALNDAIGVIDSTWVDPPIRIGPHHWVLDNRTELATLGGIQVFIGATDPPLGDVKVVRNRVSDSADVGIGLYTAGWAWVADNTVARTLGSESWEGGISVGAEGGVQVSGNVVFETGGNGLSLGGNARAESNTVIHDGSLGHVIMLGATAQLTASKNLLWSRGGSDLLRLLSGLPPEHVVALDGQWYVGESAADCHFRDNLMSYDLETWRAQTGFDQSSVCAPIPGFGAFATGIPTAAWDSAFMAAFVPPDAWSACDAPIGAFDCDAQRSGPPLEPQSGLDGLGWPGPLVVQQRYALGQ